MRKRKISAMDTYLSALNNWQLPKERAATQEQDPNGISQHEPGAKLDMGKVEPELIQRGFARALLAVAEVGTYGATKYTRDGWQYVQDGVRRYTNAMYRHLSAEHRGEQCDPDTKLLHAAHAAWNALARLELMLREREGGQ